MIPERVSEVTSATSKNEKLFDTPIGRFSYKKVSSDAYSLGIDWIYDDVEGGRFIATAEYRKIYVISSKKSSKSC